MTLIADATLLGVFRLDRCDINSDGVQRPTYRRLNMRFTPQTIAQVRGHWPGDRARRRRTVGDR